VAFRRRSNFRRASGFRRRRSGFGSWSNKKWIGFHALNPLTYQQLDPTAPQSFQALPNFIPLVRYTDYGNEALSPMFAIAVDPAADQPYTTERQERVKVLRTLGSYHGVVSNLALDDAQVVYIKEHWHYFAAYSEDDVVVASEMASTGAGNPDALAQYDLSLSDAPPLWRSNMFRHQYSVTHGAFGPVLDNFSVYHSEKSRSWDFKPNARLSTPMNWYLVMGGNMFIQSPAPLPPETAFTELMFVAARTLISD